MREVAAELERPVLLFSGGKDSIVLVRLAEKAFRPARFPFPLMHVDTGHNFPEVIDFRDRLVERLGERLVVASVEESIRQGRAVEETGPRASRNRLQTVTLLDAIAEHGFDAAFGGARRDEERARAKERIFSFRDDSGQWDPKSQRPELWSLYNGRIRRGEHVRVFPLSNWTELDVWQYIAEEELEVPSIYFAHERQVFKRDGMLYALSPFVRADRRRGAVRRPRCATARWATCPAPAPWQSTRRDARRGGGGDRRHARHRARRDARRRPRERGRDGGPQARWLLLVSPETRLTLIEGNGPPEPAVERRAGTLRIATAGSVDDGKSHADRPPALRLEAGARPTSSSSSRRRAAAAATSRWTWRCSPTACAPSASRASRSTWPTATSPPPRRRFILADTPGHVRYTRNMVTGASTADLALILVDARNGVVEQTKRHAFVASLRRRPAPHRVREQDGPGRLLRAALRGDRASRSRPSRPSSSSPTSSSSRSRRCTATTSSTARCA